MRLAEYLEKHELSAAGFGRLIGVTGSTVWRYAHGQRTPRRAIIHRIVEATGGAVTANDFLAPDEPESEAA